MKKIINWLIKQYRWLKIRKEFLQMIDKDKDVIIDLTVLFGHGYEPCLKRIKKLENKLIKNL